MSEKVPNIGDSDAFNELVAGLTADEEFRDTVAGLNDDMDMASIPTISEGTLSAYERYALPHIERSLDDVARTINEIFQQICQEHGVDPNTPELNASEYPDIYMEFGIEMCNLKNELWSGDVISATDTVILDNGATKDDQVLKIVSSGSRVIGTFFAPVIGQMPDDTHLIMQEEASDPSIGVGLMIEHPIVIDRHGKPHINVFVGDKVTISLSTTGNKLTKYQFPAGL